MKAETETVMKIVRLQTDFLEKVGQGTFMKMIKTEQEQFLLRSKELITALHGECNVKNCVGCGLFNACCTLGIKMLEILGEQE